MHIKGSRSFKEQYSIACSVMKIYCNFTLRNFRALKPSWNAQSDLCWHFIDFLQIELSVMSNQLHTSECVTSYKKSVNFLSNLYIYLFIYVSSSFFICKLPIGILTLILCSSFISSTIILQQNSKLVFLLWKTRSFII